MLNDTSSFVNSLQKLLSLNKIKKNNLILLFEMVVVVGFLCVHH